MFKKTLKIPKKDTTQYHSTWSLALIKLPKQIY